MSVLQPWVEELSLKKQTVLIGATRAPDVLTTLKLKQITVWIRAVILRDADPMTGFMHKALRELPLFEQVDREFERLPLHVAHHILLAMQVIAFEHTNPEQSRAAWNFYLQAVEAQHLLPEPHSMYEARMTDNVERVETGTS